MHPNICTLQIHMMDKAKGKEAIKEKLGYIKTIILLLAYKETFLLSRQMIYK